MSNIIIVLIICKSTVNQNIAIDKIKMNSIIKSVEYYDIPSSNNNRISIKYNLTKSWIEIDYYPNTGKISIIGSCISDIIQMYMPFS